MRNFAPRAQADLDQAVGWLLDRAGGGGAAERLLMSVLEAAALLARRPQLGRRRTDLLPDPFRFWSLPRHNLLLVYRPDTVPPMVLRVLNTSQDLQQLLAEIPSLEEPPES